MAMAWAWTAMVAASVLCGAATGRMGAVSAAAMEGAAAAVELGISLAGTLCLWSGVMAVLRRTGASDALASWGRPLLRRLFPDAARDPDTLSAVSACLSANVLGLGNAATPFGIRAAERMARGRDGTASDELCLLVVLNTASVQLLPTTAASLRAAAGCAAPFDILPAVWLSSACSVTAGILAAGILSRTGRSRTGEAVP